MTLMFPSGVLAHARMSWLDPRKTRRITVVGSRKMVVYDDLESHEKLKVYDKRVDTMRESETFGDYQFAYHYGSVVSPYIHFEEPLRVEALHFIECVANRREPLTGGREGLEVVQVVEAAQRSLKQSGAEVVIDDQIDAVLDLRETPQPTLSGQQEGGIIPLVKLNGVSDEHLVEAPASNGGTPGERIDQDKQELVLEVAEPPAAEIEAG
jgi:hypothetical protein